MALIKISDLTTDRSTDWLAPDDELTQLEPTEAESVRGGWSHRRSRQIADESIGSFTSQISSIINAADRASNSFQITTSSLSNGNNGSSIDINGVNIPYSGNFFYTDSGVSPIGASPIDGFPGAYTF